MAKNRNLGMGLDLLLAAGAPGKISDLDAGQLGRSQKIMQQALQEDETGNACEAYYLYRRLMDDLQNHSVKKNEELSAILSQAYNNAAIILYEQGNDKQARDFLHKSLAIRPNNVIAKENLAQLLNG